MRNRPMVLTLAIAVAVILVTVIFLLPKMSRLDWRSESMIRRGKLENWAGQVRYFTNETGKMPASLYEVSSIEDIGPIWVKVKVGGHINYPERHLLSDPNRFFEEIEYALVTHQQGWFIMELKPGKYYQHRLIIDQADNFFELREHKHRVRGY